MQITMRSDLRLQTCNQKENHNHLKGCYIRFKDGIVCHSKPREDCIVDYDERGEIIGIEFYEGL